MNSPEKRKVLQSVKKDLDEYFKLEDKLESLQSSPASAAGDPNLSTEMQVLKDEMSSLLKKIVSVIEEANLVNDMPKDILSVYSQLKKNVGALDQEGN